MRNFVKILEKHNLLFDEFMEMVADQELYKDDNYSVAYASLHSISEENYCFAVACYGGGGSFKHTHYNIQPKNLEKFILKHKKCQ